MPTQDVATLFAEHGLRCTQQRAEVYRALAACAAHPTADELYELVNKPCPCGECRASRATVYNALEALCGAGLARRIATGSGPCRFDADLSDHCHVLTSDGRLVDVPASESREMLESVPPSVVQRLASELGVDIEHVSITLHAGPSNSR